MSNEESEEYELSEIASLIAAFSAKTLRDPAGLSLAAEQYFLLAKDYLNQARRFAELAAIAQQQDLAAMRRR